MSEYYTKADGMNGLNGRRMIGWAFIALGLIMQVTLGRMGYYAGIGVFMLYIASWTSNNPVVSLKDDHLDMKFAPFAGRRLLRYTEVKGIDLDGPNKAWLALKDGSRIRLPWAALAQESQQSLVRELELRLNPSPKAEVV